MTLKKYNIKHAIVNSSKVEHLELEKRNEKITDRGLAYRKLQENVNFDLIKLPDYIYHGGFEFLLDDKKALEDNIKFHKKWGNPNFLYRKNKIADLFIRLKIGFINKFIL